MNRGLINGVMINGRKADPVVRVRIDARGVARIRTTDRVLAYCKLTAQPEAAAVGNLGRVEGHLSVNAQARAVVDGVIGRVDVRSLLAATGRVVIEVTLPVVRGRAKVVAKAKSTIKAHVLARGAVQSLGVARFTPVTRRMIRGPVKSKGEVRARADGTVYVRRWLRSPVQGRPQAFVVSNTHIEARLHALLQAKAKGAVTARALRRALVHSQGIAHIEINPEIHKRLPFDEPAPDSRVFIVQASQLVFYVTE
ncbi:hypothetical protein GCM10027276_03900 [Comamonas piscis]